MPKVKLPRSSPSIDMTPMVDLAFLLVTFFMLTTKFRPDEPVSVTIPFSLSQTKLPDNATTINIDSAGRVFYDMDGKDARAALITTMAQSFPAIGKLTQEDVFRFSVMGAFGQPFSQVKAYVEAGETQRKTMNSPAQTKGIPIDSIPQDELLQWVTYGNSAAFADYNAKKSAGENVNIPRFAIKADGNAKYKVVKQVIDICQKAGIQHFDLITSMKIKSTK